MTWLIKRDPIYYIRYSLAEKKHPVSNGTNRLPIAKEKLRQFESTQARGEDSPLPSNTPIANVLTAHVTHIQAMTTTKSA